MSEGAQTFLSMRAVTKRFGEMIAVDNVSLDIADGEFFTIVGPSGSGKSTLVRMLAGLEHPSAGSIMLRGDDITDLPANRRPTCMVFQSLALFDHRSVGQNIEFSQKMKGVPQQERRSHALDVMDIVRLPREFYDRPVTQCSGGERQRVALARALASDPDILFFDEPLSAIDFRLRKILEVEMKDLHRRTGKTFVYITHSLEEALVMSDRIAIMRDGKVVQIGTAEDIVMNPADDYVADFVAGISRLKVVHAHAVMQPLDAYVASKGPIPADVPRVNGAETLSNLIDLAIDNDNPIIVEADGKDVGLITRADLLRTVIEGTEVS